MSWDTISAVLGVIWTVCQNPPLLGQCLHSSCADEAILETYCFFEAFIL